jgi:hypothetical protein
LNPTPALAGRRDRKEYSVPQLKDEEIARYQQQALERQRDTFNRLPPAQRSVAAARVRRLLERERLRPAAARSTLWSMA